MSIARDVTTVGSATLLSRLLGFFRDVGIALVLGAGALSDAYFAALQIPNLFRRLLAEGAMNSAFVPMWIRMHSSGRDDATQRFGEQVLTTMMLLLGTLAILGFAFAPTLVHLLAPGFEVGGEQYLSAIAFVHLSMPYVAVIGVVAVWAAILNAEGRVTAAAFGLTVFNGVLLLAVVAVIVMGEHGVLAGKILSFSVFVAGLAQLVLVGSAVLRLRHRPRHVALQLSPDVRRFYARVIPGVVAGGIPQLKLMAGTMIASSSPAAVSWLYYANRLYELPLGVVSVAIATVIAPRIATDVLAGERTAIAAAQSKAFEISLGLAIPAAAAFALLATPIAGGLFQRGAFDADDTAAVAAALVAICAGLPGHVLEKVLGAISFAHENTRTPMYAAFCGLTVATVGAIALFPTYGHVGVAAAIGMSGWVGAAILVVILKHRRWLLPEHGRSSRLARILLASGIMAGVIGLSERLVTASISQSTSTARIATLGVLVCVGLAAYLASLQLLGIARISVLLAAARERI